jgi:hypothetical protein
MAVRAAAALAVTLTPVEKVSFCRATTGATLSMAVLTVVVVAVAVLHRRVSLE